MKDLLLTILIASCTGFKMEQNFVDSVAAVKHYFRSGCLYILHDEEHGLYQDGKLNRISNYFSNEGVSVGVIIISAPLQFPDILHCSFNRPLYVIPHSERSIRYIFQKLADKIQLSSIVWLLFLDTYSTLEKFLSDINIPFDCEFLVALQKDDHIVLTEVYRVSNAYPLQTYHFGNWTAGRGLIGPTVGLFKRRSDLQGLVFKTGTINADMITVTKEENNKPIEIGGSLGDIWHALQSTLNFSSDYYTPEDNWYGSYLDSGTWNGLIGMVMRHEVHVTNVDMTWTTDRGDVVDFITQIHQVRRHIFIGLPDSAELLWSSLLLPFSAHLWITLLLSLLALSALLWLTIKLSHRYGSELDGKEPNFSFLQSVFCAFSAFSSQGHKGTPPFTSSRIIFLTTHLTAVTILTSYSASLISSIMTRVFELPFNSFEELLKVGDYRIVAESYSSQISFFKMSHNSMLRAVYDKCIKPIENSIPPTVLERMRMTCANKKYSTIATENDVTINSNKLNCVLQKVPNAYIKGVVAFAIQKKSPYRTIFKRTLHTLLRIGLIRINEEKLAKTEHGISSVSLSQVTPIIAVLASGTAVAIFITIVERLLIWKALRYKFQGIERKKEILKKRKIFQF